MLSVEPIICRTRRTVGPTIEPISLEALAEELGLPAVDQPHLLEAKLREARETLEDWTRLVCLSTTFEMVLDRFPSCGPVRLARYPVQSIESISYLDESGDEQELDESDYWAALSGAPARIYPADGGTFPATQCGRPEAVTVTFVAGHDADPEATVAVRRAAVPHQALRAIKYLAVLGYQRRMPISEGHIVAEVPQGLATLLAHLQLPGLG